ncbi:MAG TPA: S41 family peptidase, partial [Thermoanaerobaculia bacterium]|nr:S41 family peptidase [Thermoanaerobaculia bacterium]
GQYDGDEQVYVIPATGGVPKQLTFYPARGPLNPRWGYDNQVLGWTPDGSSILYRSLRDGWDLGQSRLYTVPLSGGLGETLPPNTSGGADFSPDGRRIVYTPQARDFRTWKRYQGGWAQDLYVLDLKTFAQENVTNNPRADRDPMWIGDKIYFASDRDGHLNLFSYDTTTQQTAQLTHEKKLDVRWPSHGENGDIVYELGGELQLFDTRTGTSRPISILVPNDGVAMRPSRVSAEKQVEDFSLSPQGERALVVARGDVFTVPIEKGNTRNLTHSSNAHDKWARWSPDGAKIAYISDASGEDELYLIAQDGGQPERLTSGGKAMRSLPVWSPDGKRIAFSDKDGRIWVLTLAERKLVEIARDGAGQVGDYVWAPGGEFLAFSLNAESGFSAIHVWSAADGKVRAVTSPYVNAFNPAWDPDGDYLFYLAQREMVGQISNIEFNYAVDREVGIFALALRKDVKHPFPPESDEVKVKKDTDKDTDKSTDEDKDKKDEKDKEKKKAAVKPLKIDFDGLGDRVAAVPIEADNYTNLFATRDYLVYERQGAFFYGRDTDRKPEVVLFSRKDRKESVLAEDAGNVALSADGQKALIVQHGREGWLYPVKPEGKGNGKKVSTAGLMVDRVPSEEWAEVFAEVWRRYRDFFYVPNMHGYDWAALREQYRPLLAHVAHRSDLNYVLGEMVSELTTSHSYIEGGDFEIPPRPKVALPGARFALDAAAGRYRIAEILRGENDEERYRSPLTEVGVDARVGDYVLAIDGAELKADDSPYRLLRGKAGGTVELTLNQKPTFEQARKVTFRPIENESDLLYLNWVRRNRERVDRMTGGRVGYLHIPDMGGDGLREFIKWFYPQVRKEGLVVDIRGNGGGNVSQMIIERLRRELLSVDFSRNRQWPSTYPSPMLYGSMVCVLDELAGSDGDIFAAMFQKAGLGPVIGKRSWGGVVGINGHGPLLDGGRVFVPEAATASVDGKWIIENHGVDPDIEVENDPQSVLAGRDPQLERSIAEVLKRMEEHPRHLPQRPPDPVKTP